MVVFPAGGACCLRGSECTFAKLGIGGSGLSLIFPAVLTDGAPIEPGGEVCAAIGDSTAVEDIGQTSTSVE